MDFFKTKVGTAVQFKIIERTMREKGYTHNRTTIATYMKYLIKQKKIVNVRTKENYSFYGIPSKEGIRYLAFEKKIVELEK